MANKNRPMETSSVQTPAVGGGSAVRREATRSPAFTSVYVNDIQMDVTPWDLRIRLGEITDLPTATSPVIKVTELGEIHMSPQLAKQFTILLTGQLKTYEEQFGEIPTPKL